MNKNDKLEAKERINFFLNVLQKTMKTCDMKLGFDLKEKKLVIQDVQTKLFSRIGLEELNNY
ncbi:hypothetical protein [Clostridium neonatale]|uniref:hypothetical protein n=1 Tax=Clostridium neonatale TaxID=137838 RepID=UPI00291B50CA|nr:hypothetical protein [Clostridium neonatale]CAI3209851.1 conserved hypothetical protein [Clostridium neonatale]CAI3213928.1 conserved hypothetical protein [Clostridium neonatale]CAI3608326.1 conserved hypothetical protein [Clostridium neonatale]